MRWLFCKSCWTTLYAHHAVKTVFSRNIQKLSNIQKKSLKILIITRVCFSNACRVQLNTRAEQSTEHVVRQLCKLSIVEIFWPFLSSYLFFHYFRKILRHVLLVFNFEKMESAQSAKTNRKATTRIILFVQPWQAKHLGLSKC